MRTRLLVAAALLAAASVAVAGGPGDRAPRRLPAGKPKIGKPKVELEPKGKVLRAPSVLERHALDFTGVWRKTPKRSQGARPGTRTRPALRRMAAPARPVASKREAAPAWKQARPRPSRASTIGGPPPLVQGAREGVGLVAPPGEKPNRLIHAEGWDRFLRQWKSLSSKKHRLIDVEATPIGGRTIYSGLFAPGDGAHGFISLSDWNAFVDHWLDQLDAGMELVDFEVLAEGQAVYYLGVFRGRRVGQTMIRTSSWAQLVEHYGRFHREGLRLIDIETDVATGVRMFTGVWSSGSGGEYFYGLPDWSSFSARWSELARQGYRLIDMESFEDGGVIRYLGVWSQGDEPYAMWEGGSIDAFEELSSDLEGAGVHLIDFEVRPQLGVRSASVWLPGYREPQTITYRDLIGGHYRIEGDVLVDPTWTPARKYARASPAVKDGLGTAQQPLSSMATAHLWPVGIIPVEISADFTAEQCAAIEAAVRELDDQTVLSFYRRQDENDFVLFTPTEGLRRPTTGCHTKVGWHGGAHLIYLEPAACLTPGSPPGATPADIAGTVKHEVLHAAGFHHEQVRADRNKFVRILWSNIIDGSEGNFEMKPGKTFDQTPYDYGSIMHYGTSQFGKQTGNPGMPQLTTIVPLQQGVTQTGSNDLSARDRQGVREAYAAVVPSSRALFENGAPSVTETTYDRCRRDPFRVRGKDVPREQSPGVVIPLADNRFSWTCGDSTGWTTCPDGTTHVVATRDRDGRIQWDCLAKAPAEGARFLDTDVDRCRQPKLRLWGVDGPVTIPDRRPTFVRVWNHNIGWTCGNDQEAADERATLPEGTGWVRVAWDRSDDGRIEWQSFTGGDQSLCRDRKARL